MAVTQEAFGKSRDGRDLYLYTITNSKGMKAKVTNLGANLVELWVPDKNGKSEDIVLGYGEDQFNSDRFIRDLTEIAMSKLGVKQ